MIMNAQKLFRLLKLFRLPVRARNPRAYALYFAAILMALFFAFQKAQTETPAPKSSEPISVASGEQAVPRDDSEHCKITKITDGDTVHVRCGASEVEKVRLSNIDAPESKQAFGRRAQENLGALCEVKTVYLDRHGRDRYGRTLATLYCGGVDVNLKQVEMGYAWVYRQYVDPSKAPTFYQLEQEAQNAKRGLWADPHPVPPAEFRKKAKGGRG